MTRTARGAALLYATLIALITSFQIALVAGVPWGEAAWGGTHRGVLPSHLRWASAASVPLLVFLAWIVLVRAGLLSAGVKWQSRTRKLAWIVVVYSALGVLANAMTTSPLERLIWLPVAIALLLTSLVVARSATS